MPATDEELEAMLDDVESDRVERKRAWTGDVPTKVRQAVCAFANDLPNHQAPGYVFIGARDDGSPEQLQVTDELLRTMADVKTDGGIVPPPTITVERRMLKGAQMGVICVAPAISPPVRFDGRTWIRIGARRGQASAQDQAILNERRRHRDRSFDARPVSECEISELNRTFFEQEYLPQVFPADVLDADRRSYEERLASLGFIASMSEQTPTVAGLLTLGKSPRSWVPGAYVQFLRISGTEWGDAIVDERVVDGTLSEMCRLLDDKLRAHLTTSVDFTSDTREVREVAYPLSTLQQVARNAIMHRTYENTNAPIRVYWFDDRIEIHSPGGPFGTVTAENFGRPGVTDYRNPSIASALRALGFVQRFGYGIAESRRALLENGNPELEFTVEHNTVLATIRRRS